MKKKLFVLILLQSLYSLLFSAELKINVVDAEIEIPLEGVTISISGLTDTWITDDMGDVSVSFDDDVFAKNGNNITLSAYLPGYATKKIRIDSNTTELYIELSIDDILEGKELVVEQNAYQKTDAESGISVVITKDQFDNSSQIGSIPDVMTSVKTLPGVTYMGSFSQQPSIRGAYPYEMACSMDGTYVYSPFHWNGGVSIFDPMFIKSVKLSHGIFSARTGHATAGLLDMTTVEPEDETIKFSASVSDIITDGIFQVPITPKMGFVGGYRVSYYDTIPWFYDTFGITKLVLKNAYEGEEIPDFKLSDVIRMPNMQDFYGKYYFNPMDRLHLTVTQFVGIEGIGFHLNDETEITTPDDMSTLEYEKYYEYSKVNTELSWKNIFLFGSAAVNLLPTDNSQINLQGTYNTYNSIRRIDFKNKSIYDSIWSDVDLPADFDHSIFYTEDGYYDSDKYIEALQQYGVKRKRYSSNYSDDRFSYEDSYLVDILQGKASYDYSFENNKILSVGFEEFYRTRSSKTELRFDEIYYSEHHEEGTPEEEWDIIGDKDKVDTLIIPTYEIVGNKILNTVAYTTYEFGDSNSKLQGEAGFRFEYYYIYNQLQGSRQKVKIGTIPTFNPRISARYKPEIQSDFFQNFTISAGTGLFSNIADSLIDISAKYKIEDGKLKPDQDWFSIIGTQFDFMDNYSFQIEAYYKWYLSRFYSVGEMTSRNIFSNLINGAFDEDYQNKYHNKAFSDGTGHVFGFDTMLQKKNGRYLDGYITYSFIVSRYLNPFDPEENATAKVKTKTDTGDPLGQWYYPYFHRFHTLSTVLNYRPKNGLVFTLTSAVVSGVPVDKDNPLNELLYGDEECPDRTSISFPVNFRIGYSNYFRASKLQYEWYFGIENAFGFLNRNSLLGAINYMATHQEDTDNLFIYSDRIANFDTGLPTISLGLRISM